MLKTVIRLTICVFLALYFNEILNIIIPLPTEWMVESFLDLSKEWGRNTLMLMRVFVWTILFVVLSKIVRPVLGFALPTTRQYSVTKPVRRLQGISAEFFLFVFLFLAIAIPVSRYQVNKKVGQEIADNEFSSLKSSLIQNRTSYESDRNEKLEDWRSGFPGESYFERLERVNNGYPFIMPEPEPFETFTISFDATLRSGEAHRSLKINLPMDDGYYDGTNFVPARVHALVTDEYENYANVQNDILIQLDSLANSVKNDDVIKNYSDKAKNILQASSFDYYATSLTNIFPVVFIIALLLYALSHLPVRYSLGGTYEKILRFFEQGRFGLGGSARFAGLLEEWGNAYKHQKHGLFIGRSLYNPTLNIGLEDPRHMLTIAGSRAGKGTTAIIPNLLLWEGSALVIDPKGTNAAVTARRRREMGHKVYLVDPFNLVNEEGTDSFNPLAALDPNSPTIREEINVIADALVVPDVAAKDPHWDDGARTIIAGLIAHLVSGPDHYKPTLPLLRDLLTMMPDEQTELWTDMAINEGAGKLAKESAARINRGIKTNEILGLLSNADKHTEWLSSPAIQSAITESTFSFAELKEEPTTIYLILPPHYLETHKRFLRLFVNLAISQMSIGGRSKIPVLMIMDEFLALGRMEEVEKAFGLMAGYNLILWPFVQDFGRLKDLYNKSVNAFITNSRAVQVFGVFDDESTEFVSSRLGERKLDPFWTSSKSSDIVKMRTPSEVTIDISADSGRQYILRAGKSPMLLEKVPYYNGAASKIFPEFPGLKSPFEGLYDPDPDYT